MFALPSKQTPAKQTPAPPRPASPAQASLPTWTVNRAGDSYEQEADRAAEHVMRATWPGTVPRLSTYIPATYAPSAYAPGLQRACACGGTCADCQAGMHEDEHPSLQLKAAGSGHGEFQAPPAVKRVLGSAGQPLDAQTRAFMEPRFGSDFSRVRVHSGTEAEQSAQAVNALAYTVGPNIVFGAGQYAPSSSAGQRLLAHELAHVVQQRGTPALLQREPKPDKKDEPKEAPKKDDTKKDKDAECTYSVNYVPKGEIDCDTLFQKMNNKKPPSKLCGRALLFDIVSVTATGKCPSFKGMKLEEKVIAEDDKARCLPAGANLVNGQGCNFEDDGTLKNCHDVYSMCVELSGVNARTNLGCQQTYNQTISIGGKEVDKHKIFFDMDTTATTCKTSVTRDGKVIKPGNP